MCKCPKCGAKLEMEYVQTQQGGYDFEVLVCSTECDFYEYQK